MNRKLMTLMMGAAMLAGMTACGGETTQTSAPAQTDAPAATTTTDAPAESAAEDSAAAAPAGGVNFTWSTNGTALAINSDVASVLSALGEPQKTFEAPSCAFDGTSYTYTFAGFTLETYPDPADKTDKIFAVTLTDDTVQTNEGCKVGDKAEDVIAKCGEPAQETAGFIVYEGDGVELQFFTEGEAVTSIVYTYTVS